MVDWNLPIQTRDGRKAEFLKEICRIGYQNVVLVTNSEGRQWVGMFNDEGVMEHEAIRIINVPETVERWVNVYKHGKMITTGTFDKYEWTQFDSPTNRIGLVKLTIVDGKLESAEVVKDEAH